MSPAMPTALTAPHVNNIEAAIIVIVIVSVLPMVLEFVKHRRHATEG